MAAAVEVVAAYCIHFRWLLKYYMIKKLIKIITQHRKSQMASTVYRSASAYNTKRVKTRGKGDDDDDANDGRRRRRWWWWQFKG